MSAIVGLAWLSRKACVSEQLAGMTTALAHRGAVARRWHREGAGVGHCFSLVSPESLVENQPVVDDASGLVLVADARLDNRTELSTRLGFDAGDLSDSELVLQSYRRWGADCVSKLAGDFAFAIWDPRNRLFFCARDPMGVKPFYYHSSDRLFAFGSEIKALLTLADVPDQLDETQIARFLTLDQEDRERTMFGAIRRLPAAHTLTACSSGVQISRYWRLDPAREIRLADAGEYASAFRELFTDAVKSRMRATGPLAVSLSGGLDSSSIACMARSLAQSDTAPIHSFSIVFPGLPPEELRRIDERRYVDAVVRGGGLVPHEVRGDQLSPLTEAARALWHADEPFFAPNLYLHWAMYDAAAQAGARVFLDGFDGDTTVSHGLGRLNQFARSGDWATFEGEARAFSQHRGIGANRVVEDFGLPHLSDLARHGEWRSWGASAREVTRRFGVPLRTVAIRHGLLPLVPLSVKQTLRATDSLYRVLRAPLARAARQRADAAERALLAARPGNERDSHLEGLSQPSYQLTLELADKCAASFGLEPRYPFFDQKLIEFCLAVPADQKFAGGWPRLIFRNAMEGILPPEIQWRADKSNLAPNFHRRFRTADRAAVERANFECLDRFVDVRRLEELRSAYFAAPDFAQSPDAALLFRATLLAQWLSPDRMGVRSGESSTLATGVPEVLIVPTVRHAMAGVAKPDRNDAVMSANRR